MSKRKPKPKYRPTTIRDRNRTHLNGVMASYQAVLNGSYESLNNQVAYINALSSRLDTLTVDPADSFKEETLHDLDQAKTVCATAFNDVANAEQKYKDLVTRCEELISSLSKDDLVLEAVNMVSQFENWNDDFQQHHLMMITTNHAFIVNIDNNIRQRLGA